MKFHCAYNTLFAWKVLNRIETHVLLSVCPFEALYKCVATLHMSELTRLHVGMLPCTKINLLFSWFIVHKLSLCLKFCMLFWLLNNSCFVISLKRGSLFIKSSLQKCRKSTGNQQTCNKSIESVVDCKFFWNKM